MSSALQVFSQLEIYQPSLLALAILCLINLVQNFLTAPFAFIKQEQIPGISPQGGHGLFSFRVLRTYSNSIENVPTFGLTLLLAILLSVGATFVNWVAVIYLIFRVAFWAVYYSGIGKAAGGPRTLCFVGGLLANIVLAIACIVAVLF